jgi:hypothetical protein
MFEVNAALVVEATRLTWADLAVVREVLLQELGTKHWKRRAYADHFVRQAKI